MTPKAKLLEARVGSVVLPVHDGQMGIMRNHCPMLAELGFGIMQVHEMADRPDAFFVLEGGFVRVSENHVTVLAYDVTTFEGLDKKETETMVSHARSVVAGQEYIRSQTEAIDLKKAKFIVQMAEMAAVEMPEPAGEH
ncbi:MAG: ATP synthase F1 subunit epsilon [Planctomycetota bacterium]